jgi:molybdopterin adenylyltransferase
MQELEILSVNISQEKGTIKIPVTSIRLSDVGVEGDAHAGKWHRQVSLLDAGSIQSMEASVGRSLAFGEFAENVTTKGMTLYTMRPLDRLISGEVILEVTQIGKKCHGENCAIFRQTGDCVMPREGIFCRVIRGGILKAGDHLTYQPKVIHVAVITLSDRASQGTYVDQSGPLLKKLVEVYFQEAGILCSVEIRVLPDEPDMLRQVVKQHVKEDKDLIFTTGGTGIGPRDITPDVIRPLFTKEIPGLMEMIRVKYGMQHPNALISRSVAGLIDKTLVYTLPGSPRAVREYAGEILKTIEHSMRMIHQIDSHG